MISTANGFQIFPSGDVAHHRNSFLLGYLYYEATTLLQIAFGYLFYESIRVLLLLRLLSIMVELQKFPQLLPFEKNPEVSSQT